jgi:class 3 adenylate cyclase
VISQATESLLDPGDLPGLRLHDLGARKLREFDRPVRLYEVVPTDIRSTDAASGGRGT